MFLDKLRLPLKKNHAYIRLVTLLTSMLRLLLRSPSLAPSVAIRTEKGFCEGHHVALKYKLQENVCVVSNAEG